MRIVVNLRRTLSGAAFFPAVLTAQPSARPFEADSLTLAGLRWRALGPANFQGRVSDVVGIPSPSKTLFLAAAACGIWK